MSEKPDLDPETHEDDTVVSVWKRRMVLVLLIGLVIAVAAPTFAGCGGFFDNQPVAARFVVAGKVHEIKEDELGRFMGRYATFLHMHSDPRDPRRRGLPEGEEGVKATLQLLMLDAAAKAEGIHVPNSLISDQITSSPAFQVGGKFDESRYRSALYDITRGRLDHESFTEMLRIQARVSTYVSLYGAAYDVTPSEEAYEAWRRRNVKLSVLYVASPFERHRAKVDAMTPTDEDLRSVTDLPDVRELLKVPVRKVVEVAYMKADEMTEEQYQAARKFAEQNELFAEDRPPEAEAFILYHSDRERAFTRENWGVLADPDYPARKAKWDEEHAKREKDPEKDKLPPEEPEPKNPTADWPDAEQREFLEKWRDRVTKEVLAQRIMQHLGSRAEKQGKSFADVLPDYAAFGVKVVKNAEPLSDAEIVEKFPDPVARDSAFKHVVVVKFKPQPEGVPFKTLYDVNPPLPTTQVPDRLKDRGYMVLRLESSEPARQFPVAEKRDAVIDFWRKHKVSELARAEADDLKKKAEAAGPDAEKEAAALRQAASDAGLEAQVLRRFNRSTNAPKVPTAAPNETMSPEVQAAARRVAFRNRVQQHYAMLSTLAVGKLVDPVLVDDKSQAAYVMLVVEKHEPTPVEMQENELRQERMMLASTTMSKVGDLTGYDALAKRFNLEREKKGG